MYKILVSNDDGAESEGLRKLVLSLANFAKVYVAAPANQQSAKSMAINYLDTIHADEVSVAGAEFAYAVGGTPIDSVKFGIYKCQEQDIDIDYVISGINHGGNMGMDAHYSGTVACAKEGALCGYKSIALSVQSHEAKHFDYICNMVPDLLKLSDELGPDVVLNVNAPNIPAWEVKGVKLVKTGGKGFDLTYVETDGEGNHNYTNTEYDYTCNEPDTDFDAVLNGYASVTPLTLDMTEHRALQRIKRLSSEKTFCVFIDYQEKLIPAVCKGSVITTAAAKLARCAKALGLPVIVTQQYTKGLGPTVREVHDALNGQYEKVEKVEFSCMANNDFLDKMDTMQGRSVVLLGAESHICVQQTALDMLDAGFDVTVLSDCCSSRREKDHDAAMRLLADAGCTVTTYEAFVYRILGSSKHRQFKTISRIVTE